MSGPNTFTVESPDAVRWAVCSAGHVYYTVMHFAVTFLDSKFSISENLPSVCKSAWLLVSYSNQWPYTYHADVT